MSPNLLHDKHASGLQSHAACRAFQQGHPPSVAHGFRLFQAPQGLLARRPSVALEAAAGEVQ